MSPFTTSRDDSRRRIRHAATRTQDRHTRRALLRAGGLGLAGVVGLAGTANAAPNSLTIASHFAPDPANYIVTVSGDIEKSTAAGATLNGNDSVGPGRASGRVVNGRDSYEYTGRITQIGADEAIDLWHNGARVDPATFLPTVITIEGTGSPATYALSIDGYFVKSTAMGATINGNDIIDSFTASGSVVGGRDSYATAAEIVGLDLEDPESVTVYINGREVDPQTLQPEGSELLTFAGGGTYAFTVTGSLRKSREFGATINGNDSIDGSSASGQVRGGRDSYRFVGEIESLTTDGNVTVYRNRERIDTGGGGDSGLRLGFDQRARLHRRGETVEDFEDFSAGWEPVFGRLSSDIDESFTPDTDGGLASARLDGGAADDRIRMADVSPGGRDFSAVDLSMAVLLREATNETVTMRLLAPDWDNQLVLSRYIGANAGWHRLDLGPSAIRGSPDLTNVRKIEIGSFTGGAPTTLNVDAIRTTPKRTRGAVVLTFDDNHLSQYRNAFPVMQEFGFRGTVGVIHDLVGQPDRIPLSGMREMQAAGWTMASHPQIEGTPLATLPREDQRAAMEATKGWLVDNGFADGARCLIWPFGSFNTDSLELAGEYHELAFGGGSSPCGWQVTEAGWVPRVNADDPGRAKQAIDFAAQYNQVTTLMYHTVGGGSTRVSMAEFRDVMTHLARANVDVVTASAFADWQ